MRRSGVWAGCLEAIGLSEALKRKLYILHEDGTVWNFSPPINVFFETAGQYEFLDGDIEDELSQFVKRFDADATKQDHMRGGAKNSLRLADFASVPESIGKKSSLVLSKFASPKARAKSASVALTLFQQTCSNKQTVQSSKAVGSKAKQNRERLAGDAFIWTCPVCAWDVRADSSDKCSNDRCKHAQKTHPQVLHHRFRLAGLLCQWSKLQPIGPLTNFTAPRKEASGTKRQGPHGNLPASQKAVSNRTSKAKSKGDTVHKHRFKKLSQPNAKH